MMSDKTVKCFTEEDFEQIAQCPMCGGMQNALYYVADAEGNDSCEENRITKKVSVVTCRECGFVYAREVLSESGRRKFWERYSSQQHENDSDDVHRRNQMYQLEYEFVRQFLPGGQRKNVLDVGCAEGGFLDFFEKECNCFGTEVGDEAVQRSADRYRVYQGELSDISIDQKFDLIIFRGVIQYFRNPLDYFEKAIQLLNPQGLIFITSTPRADAFCHELFREQFNLPVCAVAGNGFTVDVLKRYFVRHGFDLAGEKYFYEETPYANVQKDVEKVNVAMQRRASGEEIGFKAPAFWGNMMSLVFKKSQSENE